MSTLSCFGFGYVAERLVGRLAKSPDLFSSDESGSWEQISGVSNDPSVRKRIKSLGDGFRILAYPRDPEDMPASSTFGPFRTRLGIEPLLMRKSNALLVSAPPGQAGCPVLARHRETLRGSQVRWIGYLSSTGVYGDHEGAWVDETTSPRPVSGRARRRHDAEAGWREMGEERGIPVAVLRLAGIYGPRRSPFERIRTGKARRIVRSGHVFSRIHVDDIVTIVLAALEQRVGGTFNLADHLPASQVDVVAEACRLLDAPVPREEPFEEARPTMSPVQLEFWNDRRRVRGTRVLETLGVGLAYPDFRAGLAQILAEESG